MFTSTTLHSSILGLPYISLARIAPMRPVPTSASLALFMVIVSVILVGFQLVPIYQNGPPTNSKIDLLILLHYGYGCSNQVYFCNSWKVVCSEDFDGYGSMVVVW
mmetsp:Transcript_5654/g.10726  ORF Transcript_5654/g.10726 Transcript_5654/m.10726 type:complete len:105 (-) Transcript_5654:2595-2909(-)